MSEPAGSGSPRSTTEGSDAVVRDVLPSRAADGAQGRRPRPSVPVVLTGVVVALVGAVGLSLVVLLGRDGPPSAPAGAPPGDVPSAAAPVTSTGTDYAAATLPDQVRELLAAAPPPATTTAAELAPLLDAGRRGSCVADLGADPAAPLAADLATLAARPVAVMVLPAPDPDVVDVFVVGPGCGSSDVDLRYFARVPRGDGSGGPAPSPAVPSVPPSP